MKPKTNNNAIRLFDDCFIAMRYLTESFGIACLVKSRGTLDHTWVGPTGAAAWLVNVPSREFGSAYSVGRAKILKSFHVHVRGVAIK